METVNRRTTYRLYPTPAQEAALQAQREAHRGLYNAALEQRRAAWKRQGITLSFAAQCRDLTVLRQEEETPLPAQAAQQTLKRVARAFEAFLRRVRQGQPQGYPRFKSRQRFKGWSYPTHGDGWRLLPCEGMQHGRLRLSGVGHVRIRGDARTMGEPKTCDITYRHGTWYASIVLACEPERTRGETSIAFDWGIETFATIAAEDGHQQQLENPRFLRRSEASLTEAYRARDTKQKFSHGWRIANRRIARLHAKIARQRLDFHHKQSAQMVGAACAVFTETLHVANMTKRPQTKQDATTGQYQPNGAAAKAGLNKAILDGAPAQFLSMLRYKAVEAGVVYAEAPTRHLKPSQRCHACWTVHTKRLDERWHACPCGASCHRDVNAALVLLHWGLEHVLSVLLAWLWRHNNCSQELAAYHGYRISSSTRRVRWRGSIWTLGGTAGSRNSQHGVCHRMLLG
jgi:putative transposase